MALALSFLLGGLGLTLLSYYFYKKISDEEKSKKA
jgi:hypothetical protein